MNSVWVVLALLATTFTFGFADKMTWSPCDVDLTSFTPSSVTLSPDPPVIGSPAVFVIDGEIDTDIQGGTVEMTVSFSGFPIFSSTSDLCTKTACPVPAGPVSITLEEALPPIAPPGDYGLQVLVRAADASELTCVNVNFTLVLPSATRAGGATAAVKDAVQLRAAGQEGAGSGANAVQYRRSLRVGDAGLSRGREE